MICHVCFARWGIGGSATPHPPNCKVATDIASFPRVSKAYFDILCSNFSIWVKYSTVTTIIVIKKGFGCCPCRFGSRQSIVIIIARFEGGKYFIRKFWVGTPQLWHVSYGPEKTLRIKLHEVPCSDDIWARKLKTNLFGVHLFLLKRFFFRVQVMKRKRKKFIVMKEVTLYICFKYRCKH